MITDEDLDARVQAAKFAREFLSKDVRLERLERTGMLGHAAVDGGTLPIYDDDGQLRVEIGVQPDGTAGVVHIIGPPPPKPTVPLVEPALGGVRVTWDGKWADADEAPSDFARVQIHRVATTTTAPDPTVLPAATFDSPAGGSVVLAADTGTTVTVRLVAFNLAGIPGQASDGAEAAPRKVVGDDLLNGIISELKLANEAVSAAKIAAGAVGTTQISDGAITTPKMVAGSIQGDRIAVNSLDASRIVAASITGDKIKALEITGDKIAANTITGGKLEVGTVTADRLLIGLGSNLLPDPGFETTLYATKLAPNFTLDPAVGNPTGKSLRADCTSVTPANRVMELTRFPCLPGDQYYLAVDYRLSADWVGTFVQLYLDWLAADGTAVGSGGYAGTNSPVKGSWQRVSATVTVPPGAVTAVARVAANNTTVGTAWWDNGEVRPLTKGTQIADGAITTQKIAVGAVAPSQMSTGAGANLIPDPSFEGAQSLIHVDANWSIVTPGNNSGKALAVNSTSATPLTRGRLLTTIPILPGEKLWLGYDLKTDAAWTATQVIKMYAKWLDSAGTTLGYGTVQIAPGVSAPWARYVGLRAAPVNAVTAQIFLEAFQCTAGTATFDNVEVRTALMSASTGRRAEISPEGLRLYDEDGDEAVALVTGRPNYLTFQSDGLPICTIAQNGNASFQATAVTKLSVAGQDFEDRLAKLPRGLIAWSAATTYVETFNGEKGWFEVPFTAVAGRLYRIYWEGHVRAAKDGGNLDVRLRSGGANSPTITSTELNRASATIDGTGNGGWKMRVSHICWVGDGRLSAGVNRVLVTMAYSSAPTGQGVAMFGFTEAPAHMTIEDIGPFIPGTGQYNTGGAATAPPIQQYVKTYGATWSGSYQNRGSYNSYFGNEVNQGYYGSTNGMQAGLVGFDGNALNSDLSGATINKVEVYLYAHHWYANVGGDAAIRVHGFNNRPGSFAADGPIKWVEDWPRNVGKWIDITDLWGGNAGWRGVALDPNNSNAENYGKFDGVGWGNPPQLRITYTK